MSLSLWAMGSTPKYHYQNDNCIEGSYFDTLKLISLLSSMSPTTGGAIATGADYLYPQADMSDAMAIMAQIEFLHLLKNGVDRLAMQSSNPSNGYISLHLKQKSLLWTDTVRDACYYFYPGDDPGTEFVKAIIKPLQDTSMNTWGALRALQGVLNAFADVYDDDAGCPKMYINLVK